MSQRVAVVTGGAGFIGRALAETLIARGERVVIIDNLSLFAGRQVPPLPSAAELVVGDVRDTGFVRSLLERERPDVVYHLAAIHYIPCCDADPVECVSVNTAGTTSVLDACAGAATRPSCVLTSTAAVYEPADVPHTESGPLRPVDVYGLSKLWAEQLAQLYWQRDGLNISVGRVFNVYGPGETNPHLIPSLIDQALGGSVILVGNLATSRDYVHVDDVARALVAMGQRKQTPAMLCVNLGSGRAISGARVVETIGRCLGRALETSTEPSRLRQVDRPMLLSDPSLAAELIGWRAQVSFEDGMRDLVRASLAAGTRV